MNETFNLSSNLDQIPKFSTVFFVMLNSN
jgi:hypothetical protein